MSARAYELISAVSDLALFKLSMMISSLNAVTYYESYF